MMNPETIKTVLATIGGWLLAQEFGVLLVIKTFITSFTKVS